MIPLYDDGIFGFYGEYRFLSNFWPVVVTLDCQRYPSVEHAYQAAKCLDVESRVAIQAAATASVAKRMGRFMKMRPDWDEVKVSIMEDLLLQKFTQEPFKSKLLLTSERYIEETNTWNDTFWGVCNGKGQNVLGNLIMKIRKKLQTMQDRNNGII